MMSAIPPLDREVDERLYLSSLSRALDVLESFDHSNQRMTLARIAERTGAHKSAINRVVQTLLYRGYLTEGGAPGYALGSRVMDLTFEYLRSHPYVIRAAPVMAELRRTLGERVDFSLFEYTSIIYALRMQSRRETLNASLVGRRLPSFATSGGRACLACLPDDLVRDILERSERTQFTPRTVTDIPSLMQIIAQAREDLYCMVDGEYLRDEIVVAAAIRGPNGFPVGAIHVAGTQSELTREQIMETVVPHLLRGVREIQGATF